MLLTIATWFYAKSTKSQNHYSSKKVATIAPGWENFTHVVVKRCTVTIEMNLTCSTLLSSGGRATLIYYYWSLCCVCLPWLNRRWAFPSIALVLLSNLQGCLLADLVGIVRWRCLQRWDLDERVIKVGHSNRVTLRSKAIVSLIDVFVIIDDLLGNFLFILYHLLACLLFFTSYVVGKVAHISRLWIFAPVAPVVLFWKHRRRTLILLELVAMEIDTSLRSRVFRWPSLETWLISRVKNFVTVHEKRAIAWVKCV